MSNQPEKPNKPNEAGQTPVSSDLVTPRVLTQTKTLAQQEKEAKYKSDEVKIDGHPITGSRAE